MKVLKYRMMTEVNYGTEEHPDIQQIFSDVTMGWNEANEEIAKREAYNGEYTIEDVPMTMAEARASKEAELSTTCNEIIVAGMDVETSKGLEHFSLQETDQINLATAINAIQQGLTEYPYHADGELCRMFTAEEILSIADAATKHKLYHTTLCNHLLTWVRRAEDVDEINNITYSQANMPDDLRANMMSILSSSQSLSL